MISRKANSFLTKVPLGKIIVQGKQPHIGLGDGFNEQTKVLSDDESIIALAS